MHKVTVASTSYTTFITKIASDLSLFTKGKNYNNLPLDHLCINENQWHLIF